jgi:hypothetical protein
MTSQGSPHLSPADAAVAMRSWPRRYRAALAPIDDDQVAELALRLGPDGVSALDLAADTVRTWTLLDRALHEIRFSDAPTLHPAVADSAARTWDSPASETIESIIEQIDDVAGSLADAIESMPADDWSRTAPVAGGGSIAAIDVAREAVLVGSDNLRAIERTIDAVR